ncbi:hypothetical protein, partial [Methylobacterium oxalidis]
ALFAARLSLAFSRDTPEHTRRPTASAVATYGFRMHITTELKPTAAQSRFLAGTKPAVSNSVWKPQPCGLTREELRKIVLEQLG